jgi:hypothetical protein
MIIICLNNIFFAVVSPALLLTLTFGHIAPMNIFHNFEIRTYRERKKSISIISAAILYLLKFK